MSDHLSTQLLELYRQRQLDPGELLAFDEHLAICAACRERLREMKSRSAALLALQTSLQESGTSALDHLRREQLMAYREGHLDEVDRELAESHLEACAACAARAQELAAGEQTNLVPSSASPPRGRLIAVWERFLSVPPMLRVAGAAVMTALLVIAIVIWLRSGTDRQEMVEHPPAPQPPVAPQGPQPETPATILVALNDGGERITLDAQGNLAGLDALSPADQERVRTALITGKVQGPSTLNSLSDASAPSMGRPEGSTFRLLSPVGRIIASDRPTFRWRPLAGAISYQVTIADPEDAYKEIASSPEIKDTRWKADRRLARGRVYVWQVIARTSNGEVKAPASDAPEARFKMLEQAKADEVARAKRVYAGRHLTMGIVYAEAGLLDEAEREFEALVRANPQSPVAKSLLSDLRSGQRNR